MSPLLAHRWCSSWMRAGNQSVVPGLSLARASTILLAAATRICRRSPQFGAKITQFQFKHVVPYASQRRGASAKRSG